METTSPRLRIAHWLSQRGHHWLRRSTWNSHKKYINNPCNFLELMWEEQMREHHFTRMPVWVKTNPRWRTPFSGHSVLHAGRLISPEWLPANHCPWQNPQRSCSCLKLMWTDSRLQADWLRLTLLRPSCLPVYCSHPPQVGVWKTDTSTANADVMMVWTLIWDVRLEAGCNKS